MALPQWVTDLKARRDNIAAELAAIDNTTTRQNPGSAPEVTGDGGGVADTAYRQSIVDELAKLNTELLRAYDIIAAEDAALNDGVYEIVSEVESY